MKIILTDHELIELGRRAIAKQILRETKDITWLETLYDSEVLNLGDQFTGFSFEIKDKNDT